MSLVIIVPGFDGVHLFTTDDTQLEHRGQFATTPALLNCMGTLKPRPNIVLSAGLIEPEPWDALLDLGDVFIVPEAWLQPLPKHAVHSRARLAVRIFDAHRTEPIQQLFGRAYPDLFPF